MRLVVPKRYQFLVFDENNLVIYWFDVKKSLIYISFYSFESYFSEVCYLLTVSVSDFLMRRILWYPFQPLKHLQIKILHFYHDYYKDLAVDFKDITVNNQKQFKYKLETFTYVYKDIFKYWLFIGSFRRIMSHYIKDHYKTKFGCSNRLLKRIERLTPWFAKPGGLTSQSQGLCFQIISIVSRINQLLTWTPIFYDPIYNFS